MIDFAKLKNEVLQSGHVGEYEVQRLCEQLYAEGRLDYEVAEFLASIRMEARSACPTLEDLFYDTIKHNAVVNDCIAAEQASWLRSVLFVKGSIDDRDKRILWKLKHQAKNVSPEFRQMYDELIG